MARITSREEITPADNIPLWCPLQKHHIKEHAVVSEIGQAETAAGTFLRQRFRNEGTPGQTGLQLCNFK